MLLIFLSTGGLTQVYFEDLDFYLHGTESEIVFEDQPFSEEVYIGSEMIELDSDHIIINETSGSSSRSVIHSYNPDPLIGSGGLYLNLTSSTEGDEIDYRFSEFPDQDYSVEVDGGEDYVTSFGGLNWSYSDFSEKRFEVYELTEVPLEFEEPAPTGNLHHEEAVLGVDVEGPYDIDVEAEIDGPEQSSYTEEISGGTRYTEDVTEETEPQKSYNWNITFETDQQKESTPDYSFTTITAVIEWDWSPEGPNDEVHGFRIYENGEEVKDVPGSNSREASVSENYFEFGEEYCFEIEAYNIAGSSDRVEAGCVTP